MKLSISLPAIYSVYKISLEDAYRALYGCGFRNTCIIEAIDKKKSGLKDHYDAAIRADLKPLTVRIECNPFDSEDAFSFVKQTVKRVGEYGINTAIIPTGTIKNIGHYDYLARNEMYLNSILAIAEKKETQLLFENSGSYQIAHYLHHARTIHLLTDRISHPLLGVNVNVGNLGLAEAQPYPQIRLLGDLVKGIDLSDNFGAMPLAVHPERQDFQMLPLMGAIDFDQVFQALVEIGFDGVCNLTVNLPKANYTTFASTGRPKMSLSMTNRVYAWTFRVVQRMLQSYNLFQA